MEYGSVILSFDYVQITKFCADSDTDNEIVWRFDIMFTIQVITARKQGRLLDEMTFAAFEVWMSNFIPHFAGHMIVYRCWD